MSGLIKVCHLTSVHSLYDTRILYKECRTLAAVGYDVNFIVKSEEKKIIENVTILPLKAPNNRFMRMTKTLWDILRLAYKVKAKIYHFHDPELIPIGILLRMFGKKVIYDVHEDVPLHILNKDWLGNKIVREIIVFCYRLFEKIGIKVFNAIITVTPDIKKNYHSDKTILLRNFPEIDLIRNAMPIETIKKSKPVIIYTGGLTKYRGITELIEAVKILNGKCELWLFGLWEDDSLYNSLKQLEGWKYVQYFGFKKNIEIYSYLKIADIGIATLYPLTNYLKSLPIKVFEYMACSIPTIMSNFPYWIEIFNSCSLFADPKTPEGIAEKINILIDNKELRLTLGKNGKELVQKYYSWEAESKKLLELYSDLAIN